MMSLAMRHLHRVFLVDHAAVAMAASTPPTFVAQNADDDRPGVAVTPATRNNDDNATTRNGTLGIISNILL
jgi:hypothetical protein